jgi:hypothetical protein
MFPYLVFTTENNSPQIPALAPGASVNTDQYDGWIKVFMPVVQSHRAAKNFIACGPLSG